MNAAKKGYVAEFVTGYLQREIRELLKVANGTDSGLRNPFDKGIAVGRLVKKNGDYIVPAANLSDAEYIIAQSDDTIRDVPSDYNYQERYSNLPNLIVKNSEEAKTVALYKIVNKDDIKLKKIAEPVDIITGAITGGNTFTAGPRTYMFEETGVNAYRVLGEVIYTVSNPDNNPDGNILTFKLKNADITNKSQLPEGDIYKRVSNEASHPVNTATREDFEDDGSVVCNIWVNNLTGSFTIDIEWVAGEVSHYVFDLTNLTIGEA